MTTQEFKARIEAGQPTNIEVHFYADSDMIREPKKYTVDSVSDWNDVKAFTWYTLRQDRKFMRQNLRTAKYTKTLWATFTPEGEAFDLFDEREKIQVNE